MDTLYTEFEFEPVENAVLGSFYQSLKSVPTAVVYRQREGKLERLAIILRNDRNRGDVEALAENSEFSIRSIHDITEMQLSAITGGDYSGFMDGFDTRDDRYWIGEMVADDEEEPSEDHPV